MNQLLSFGNVFLQTLECMRNSKLEEALYAGYRLYMSFFTALMCEACALLFEFQILV